MKTLFSCIAILFATLLLVAWQGTAPTTSLSCQVLDNAICTSTVDASGNPSYIAQGTLGSRLTITGTNWTGYIAGIRQVMSGTYTDAITGLSASTFNYIYVKQDSTGTIAAADFGATILAPVYSYKAPTLCTGAGVAAPQYWFDLSTNQWQVSTAAACSFSAASPQVIFLGLVWVTVTPTISGVAHEPYRLNPYRRFELFGDGFDANSGQGGTDITKQEKTSGTTTLDNWHTYTSFEATGATIVATIPATNGTTSGELHVYSQNPVLVVNTSSVNTNGLGRAGGAAATTTCSTSNGASYGGAGGGGGGASATSAGCAGGSREVYYGFTNLNGGSAGAIGGNGGAGTSTPSVMPEGRFGNWMGFVGCSGGSGGGDGGAGSGGAGGAGGGLLLIRAPSVIEDSGSTISSNGVNGGNGGGTNGGAGGGGGGGFAILQVGFSTISGTFTASLGSGGTKAGGGGNGGNGTVGITQNVKLW